MALALETGEMGMAVGGQSRKKAGCFSGIGHLAEN
jgi:hypothetical protein